MVWYGSVLACDNAVQIILHEQKYSIIHVLAYTSMSMLPHVLARAHIYEGAFTRRQLASTFRLASTKSKQPIIPPRPQRHVEQTIDNGSTTTWRPRLLQHLSSQREQLRHRWAKFTRRTLQEWMIGLSKFVIISVLAWHISCEYFFTLQGAWGISMLPTISAEGDMLCISKYYRRGRGLGVGDVVSFRSPIAQGEYAVKRIIGMPGDFVLRGTPDVDGMMMQVPTGHCWVVGDNLTYSRDSRIWGPLPLALVTGKVIGAWEWQGWRYRSKPLNHGLQDAVLDQNDDGDID